MDMSKKSVIVCLNEFCKGIYLIVGGGGGGDSSCLMGSFLIVPTFP
jgi:hypothetical protein